LRNRIGVLGLVGDDPTSVVQILAVVLDHLVVTRAPTPDAADPDAVLNAARANGMAVEAADTIPAALELASGVATTEDAVVITGGLQTVGAARRALGLAPADDLLRTS
jgi:folylpolyglutamate synthase/dihydropteroate synthase